MIALMPQQVYANYTISPITLTLEAEDKIGTLNLTNISGTKKTLQVMPYLWTQSNNKDLNSKTNDILINPPIFSIESGETQLIRYAVREIAADKRQEKSYRIVLREIDNTTRNTTEGINILLTVKLPLFLRPSKIETKPITCTYDRPSKNMIDLTCENTNNTHVFLSGIKINRGTSSNIFKYILANNIGKISHKLDSAALNDIKSIEVSYIQNNNAMTTNAISKK